YDTIIANGTVVSAEGQEQADVAIRGEKIAAVGKGLAKSAAGATVIDAAGKYVIPGALDVHVHLELPFCGTGSSDDWNTGTRAPVLPPPSTSPFLTRRSRLKTPTTIGWGGRRRRALTTPSTCPSPTGTATAPRWKRWSRWAARPSRNS